MPGINRKQAIELLASLTLLPAWLKASGLSGKNSKLCFSTIGCPGWTLQKITEFAIKNNYSGIEFRGINGKLYLPDAPEFSAAGLPGTLQLLKAGALKIAGLGSSANLHIPAKTEREKQLNEARAYIELAEKVHCPYIRVFPNNLPDKSNKTATLNLIAQGMQELADYARQRNVTVLLETHGDVVLAEDIQYIFQQITAANTGVIWDVCNMWMKTAEPADKVYQLLQPYIKHVHLKDAVMANGKIQYVPPGQGNVPLVQPVQLLNKNNYSGFYCFEWEKLWHPQLAEAENVFPLFPPFMQTCLNTVNNRS